MAKTANIELNIEEINLLIKYLDCDVCAYHGCLDKEAENCNSCKITTMDTQIFEKLRLAKHKLD